MEIDKDGIDVTAGGENYNVRGKLFPGNKILIMAGSRFADELEEDLPPYYNQKRDEIVGTLTINYILQDDWMCGDLRLAASLTAGYPNSGYSLFNVGNVSLKEYLGEEDPDDKEEETASEEDEEDSESEEENTQETEKEDDSNSESDEKIEEKAETEKVEEEKNNKETIEKEEAVEEKPQEEVVQDSSSTQIKQNNVNNSYVASENLNAQQEPAKQEQSSPEQNPQPIAQENKEEENKEASENNSEKENEDLEEAEKENEDSSKEDNEEKDEGEDSDSDEDIAKGKYVEEEGGRKKNKYIEKGEGVVLDTNILFDFEVSELDLSYVTQRKKLGIKQGSYYGSLTKDQLLACRRSNFMCEVNATHKSFLLPDGRNFLEVCYVVPLSEQKNFKTNLDCPANMVVLCPTCAKLIKYGEKNALPALLRIYSSRKDEMENAGIEISFKELCYIYKIPYKENDKENK